MTLSLWTNQVNRDLPRHLEPNRNNPTSSQWMIPPYHKTPGLRYRLRFRVLHPDVYVNWQTRCDVRLRKPLSLPVQMSRLKEKNNEKSQMLAKEGVLDAGCQGSRYKYERATDGNKILANYVGPTTRKAVRRQWYCILSNSLREEVLIWLTAVMYIYPVSKDKFRPETWLKSRVMCLGSSPRQVDN